MRFPKKEKKIAAGKWPLLSFPLNFRKIVVSGWEDHPARNEKAFGMQNFAVVRGRYYSIFVLFDN
jgi:hypothetical protein